MPCLLVSLIVYQRNCWLECFSSQETDQLSDIVSEHLVSHMFETVYHGPPYWHAELEEEKMVVLVLTSLSGTCRDPCLHSSWYLTVHLLWWIHCNIDRHLGQGEELFQLKASTSIRVRSWEWEEDFRLGDLWVSGPASHKEFYGILVG